MYTSVVTVLKHYQDNGRINKLLTPQARLQILAQRYTNIKSQLEFKQHLKSERKHKHSHSVGPMTSCDQNMEDQKFDPMHQVQYQWIDDGYLAVDSVIQKYLCHRHQLHANGHRLASLSSEMFRCADCQKLFVDAPRPTTSLLLHCIGNDLRV